MAYKDLSDPRNKAAKLRHYYKNKDQYLHRNQEAKDRKTTWLREQKSVPCMDCDQSYPYWVMDFDHRDAADKLGSVRIFVAHSWKKLKAEVAKCDVVCSNCHRQRTHDRMVGVGRIELPATCLSDTDSTSELNAFGLW